MKRLMIIVAVCLALIGCTETDNSPVPNAKLKRIDSPLSYACYNIIEIEGHKYLVTICRDGISTIHAESCSCKEKQTESEIR